MEIQKLQLWEKVPEVDGVEAKDLPAFTYYPAITIGGKARGVVLVLPGGGYSNHANHEGHSIACWLNGQGIHAYVLKYRVSPHRHPAPLADVQRAVRMIRSRTEECGYENKVGVLGFSAGGHLCASAVTMYDWDVYEKTDEIDKFSAKPDAGILCYPVASFGEHAHVGSANNLLGADHDLEQRKKMSPEEHINVETPTCFIWSTSNDPVVKVQNSLLFAQKLANNGIQFELHVYPNGPHGIGMHNLDHYENCRDWAFACEKWLHKIGF